MRRATRLILLGLTLATGCGPSSNGSDAGPGDAGPGGVGGVSADGSTGSGGAGTGGGGSAGTGGTAGAGGADGGTAAIAMPIVRTLAFHEITRLTTNPTRNAVLAGNASRVVYPVAPGTGDPAMPNRIFVVDADGNNLREVDSYKTKCFCGSWVDISADGQTVVSTEEVQVRVAGADGSKKGALEFDSNEIWNIDISADGGTVFFLQRRNNRITGGMEVERGVWAMNADGTNHRQIIGATSVAPVLGTTADKVFPFAGCGKSLEASGDGRRVVAALQVEGGQYVIAIESGSARKLLGPVQAVDAIAISGDGNTVAAYNSLLGGTTELVVMGFDGNGKRTLSTVSQGSCNTPLALSNDGSQLLTGSLGILYPTAGGDPTTLIFARNAGELGGTVAFPCCDANPLMSMANDGRRFAFLSPDLNAIRQIATLELGPAGLGMAPVITMPAVSSSRIVRGGDGSVVTARVGLAGGSLVQAGMSLFFQGRPDDAGSFVSHERVLRDDGMNGDATAGDGTFTTIPGLTATAGATPGPRIGRVRIETKGADGKRHATAVDFTGLEVQ
jgi:hypothetical protein